MARVVVLASPPIADGFRLAGPATHVARPGPEAAKAAKALAGEGDIGVLLVTEDLWTSLDVRLRSSLERLPRPIVQPIPAGTVTDVTTRRQLLGEMLQRAIGYRVELSGARTPGEPDRSARAAGPLDAADGDGR